MEIFEYLIKCRLSPIGAASLYRVPTQPGKQGNQGKVRENETGSKSQGKVRENDWHPGKQGKCLI